MHEAYFHRHPTYLFDIVIEMQRILKFEASCMIHSIVLSRIRFYKDSFILNVSNKMFQQIDTLLININATFYYIEVTLA